MSWEAMTAIGTFITSFVLAAAAIAAIIQLRHTRGSNQIIALTECRETIESREFSESQRFVSFELPKRFGDVDECRKMAVVPFSGEYEAIGTVANFFESMGLFVKTGIIDRRIACDFWSYIVMRNWNALLPITTYARYKLTAPQLWENFEYLAALSKRHMDENPSVYPSGVPRMPEDRSLIDAIETLNN
jgi:hypothetical protein